VREHGGAGKQMGEYKQNWCTAGKEAANLGELADIAE
jgi:hypothetical protein